MAVTSKAIRENGVLVSPFGVHEYTCIVNPFRPPYINVSEHVLVITNTLHDKCEGGKSTVCSVVHKVCEAIYEDLLNVYVKFSTGDELKNVVRGYEES
jgi:hypothetical protein